MNEQTSVSGWPKGAPALSIKQPWAWLIVNGFKDIENRSWKTLYRGPLLIHAGKGFDKDFDFDWADGLLRAQGAAGMPRPDHWQLGGMVGCAELVDCVAAHASPWFFGPFGYVLRGARPLPFRPLRGQLGFFDPERAAKTGAPAREKAPDKAPDPKPEPPQGRLL